MATEPCHHPEEKEVNSAHAIVDALLEADAKGELLGVSNQIEQDRAAGRITAQTADDASVFYHRTQTYKRSNTPIQVRRMGRTKRWVTRPTEFRIPVKYGMYDSFYIDHTNAHEWSLSPHPSEEKDVPAEET